MYIPAALSTLCSYHHRLQNVSSSQVETLCSIPAPAPDLHHLLSVSKDLTPLETSEKWKTTGFARGDWLTPLGMMPLKSIHVVSHERESVNHSVMSDSLPPHTIVHQAPLSMGFSRQEYWSGLPFPSPGHLPNPWIKPGSPALRADSLPSEPPGKTLLHLTTSLYKADSHSTVLRPHNFFIHHPSMDVGVLLLFGSCE